MRHAFRIVQEILQFWALTRPIWSGERRTGQTKEEREYIVTFVIFFIVTFITKSEPQIITLVENSFTLRKLGEYIIVIARIIHSVYSVNMRVPTF